MKHDHISKIIKQGAFVLPPPKRQAILEEPDAEPTPIEPVPPMESLPLAVEESPGIEVLATELEMQWKYPTESQPPLETYHADESEIPPELGEVITCVVVMWDAAKMFGLARRIGETSNRKGRRDGLYFSVLDLITVGEEWLRPGSTISGTVAEPRHGHKDRRLVNVEIYQEET